MLDELHRPFVVHVVVGRDRSWSGSLGGASPELPLSRQCPHRAGLASCTRPPTQNPACRFPAPGSPGRTHGQASSDSRMTGLRVGQFEPRAVQEVAPEQPVTLAASAQNADPLQLYLVPYRIESRLAVMQSEVLVEATQHRRQLTLLVSSLPVPMARKPLFSACQKLVATLPTRETNYRELPAAIRSTYVRETQKVKRLGSFVVCRLPISGEASEEQQPRLVIGQCQVKSRESFPQLSVEVLRVPLVLETHHKIVRKPNQMSLASKPPSHLLLEPQVEHKVQIHVGQKRAERAALRRPLLRSDDDAVLHDAGPEPFAKQAQDDPVGNAVRHHPHQPLMIDVVKVSADVGLVEMPHFLSDQCGPQGTQYMMRAASPPKSIRAVQKVRLEHCFQNARDCTLNQSVFDRGNAQLPRSDFARTFRYLHPTYRWRLIGPCFQPCIDILDSSLPFALELLRSETLA